ncbi:hypothetical protein CCMA1212_003591 [Trichoderma ghanense]|uniref:Uncharacterized protein n=1 Tax=Trichoderma ghanense TaxID=65468 RepID=A0ABY2H849_9HYPO
MKRRRRFRKRGDAKRRTRAVPQRGVEAARDGNNKKQQSRAVESQPGPSVEEMLGALCWIVGLTGTGWTGLGGGRGRLLTARGVAVASVACGRCGCC